MSRSGIPLIRRISPLIAVSAGVIILLVSGALAIFLLSSPAVASATVSFEGSSFQGIGHIPYWNQRSAALDVSADGSVVVGMSSTEAAEGQPEAVLWTQATGLVQIGQIPGGRRETRAYGVSEDGSTIVGLNAYGGTYQGFVWTASTGMQGVGYLAGGLDSQADDVSADGAIVVGFSSSQALGGQKEAFRWTAQTGIVGLGVLPGDRGSHANAISGNGLVIVGKSSGFGSTKAFRWTSQTGMTALDDPYGNSPNYAVAYDASYDGSVIVGAAVPASNDRQEAVIWTSAGSAETIGDLPGGGVNARALGVSGDGRYVVGTSETADGMRAFIWDRTNGMRDLKLVLETEFGLDLSGWILYSANAISSDASTIVGDGRRGGSNEGWVARVHFNSPPIADAGSDFSIHCTAAAGTPVQLNGSASSDPDSDPLTYIWAGPFPEGNGIVSGASPTVTLPIGSSTITLTVNDGQLASEPDAVTVHVVVGVGGFLEPMASLVATGSLEVPLPSRAFRAGRTIPLKMTLTCGGAPLSDSQVAPPRIVSLYRAGDAVPLDVIDPNAGESNDNGLLFRFSDDKWIYNLSTVQLRIGTFKITVETPDGRRWDGAFVLR